MSNPAVGERSFESRLKDVLDMTDTIVWEVDLGTNEVEYFGPIERVTGLSTEALQDPLAINTKVIHPEDQVAVAGSYESLLDGGEEFVTTEYRTNPDNGPVRWLRTQSFLQEVAGKSAPVLIGMSIEITSQKQQEARLKEFAGVVAHDLRNPLNVAQGRLELAREETDNEHVAIASGALDRVEQLIEDLLLLARSGETVGEQEAVALAAVADRAWENVAVGDATLDVETDRPILADESRLQQLLENLLRNAVEHGGPGVTVTVGSLRDEFFVEDDGAGIPEAELNDLFRTDREGAIRKGGLGLQIAAQIVAGHGWEISAAEGAAGGARFEVTDVESA